jgi:hypothetical protein
MDRRWLWALVTGGALLAGGLGLASCGGDDDAGTTETTQTQPTLPTTTDTTTPTTTTKVEPPTVVRVRVVGGVPEGGIVRKTVQKGDRILLVVSSDVSDEVHVHGYDLMQNVAAGGTARIRFRATLPGRFEVELEDRGVQLADLTVQP